MKGRKLLKAIFGVLAVACTAIDHFGLIPGLNELGVIFAGIAGGINSAPKPSID